MATTSDKFRVSVALAMEVRWKGRSSMRIAEDTADHYDEQGLYAIASSTFCYKHHSSVPKFDA